MPKVTQSTHFLKNRFSIFLLQPYPFYYQGKGLLAIMGLLFSMTFGFNYFFEPFHVDYSEHKMHYFWISMIHSLTPVVVAYFLSLVVRMFNNEQQWNIWKEALLISVFFLTVGLVQFLIRDIIYDNANNWSLQYLYEEVRNTFLVGTLFIMILIPLNFYRLNAKHVHNADAINSTVFLQKSIDTDHDSKSIVQIEDMRLDINDFIYAKAYGNYAQIYLDAQNSKKKLIRITLKKIESLLEGHSNVLKTHRSYLVNKHFIQEVKGNAQGYQLHLKNGHTIPVSRNMIPNFNKNFGQS